MALPASLVPRPEPKTARAIIERRLGRPLPPLRDMAADEREAVKRLAIQLIRNRKGEPA